MKTLLKRVGICRETFHQWRRAYEAQGKDALTNSKPCPENHKLRIPQPKSDKRQNQLMCLVMFIFINAYFHVTTNLIFLYCPKRHV